MRVALAHDYLTQYGGAERVLDVLHETWPDAPILTSIFEPAAFPPEWRTWPVRESFMGKLPAVAKVHRALLPLYPVAFATLGRSLRAIDALVSDSSAWAHHTPAPAGAVHVCYCHSPARFLWKDPNYLGPARIPGPLRPLAEVVFAGLRKLDVRAARRVDQYVAGSRAVAARVREAYGIVAPVVYPPVDVERFQLPPSTPDPEPEDWYIVISRLVPHKRIDLAVQAFTEMGRPLKIVGDGRAAERLKAQAGPTVEFLGWRSDDEVADLLRRSRGLVLPGVEDFGITAVEAQAAGRPVIAFDAGGARESVIAGETGLFFPEATAPSLSAAIRRADAIAWDPAKARANAARFSADRFRREIVDIVEATVARKRA